MTQHNLHMQKDRERQKKSPMSPATFSRVFQSLAKSSLPRLRVREFSWLLGEAETVVRVTSWGAHCVSGVSNSHEPMLAGLTAGCGKGKIPVEEIKKGTAELSWVGT